MRRFMREYRKNGRMRFWSSADETSQPAISQIALGNWLPDMDLNHDKQIQSLLCYRYTIGQAGACGSVNLSRGQSSRQTGVPAGRKTIAHGFNRGSTSEKNHKPRRGGRNPAKMFCRPFG